MGRGLEPGQENESRDRARSFAVASSSDAGGRVTSEDAERAKG